MSSPTLPAATATKEPEFEYRSMSRAAVACVAFAILSFVSFASEAFVILPLLGVCFGVLALVNLWRYPGELSGALAAKLGLGVSSILLVASVGYHVTVYLTEVPDGYTRINFYDLRPNPRTPTPFSEKAQDLDGKKVFLRGYVRPGAKRIDLQDFILVGDFGDCCFGGSPKITEVIHVNIITDETVDHSYNQRRIGGTFRLNPASRTIDEDGIPQVFYEIEADYIR